MSDNSGNGVFVLHSVSGCYAEVHISSESYSLNGIAYTLVTLTNEQVNMVRHQAVGIERAIGATTKTIVIILIAHPIERIDELVIVLCLFEYVLVVNSTHHHVKYPSSRGCTCLAWHSLLFAYSLFIKPAIPKANNPRVPNPARHVYLIILSLF